MPLVRFVGTVSPEIYKVNFPKSFSICWGSGDLGFPLNVTATILNSAVEAICEVPRFEEKHLSVLLARARNLVEAITDMVAFRMGLGLRVDFTNVVTPDGTNLKLTIRDENLGAVGTAFTFPPKNTIEDREFDDVVKLVLAEPELMGSLSDLAQVLREYGVTTNKLRQSN